MNRLLNCEKCNTGFNYDNEKTYLDNNGYGYSTKLQRCPCCGSPVIIKYYEDRAMKLNMDSRYYDYTKNTFIK